MNKPPADAVRVPCRALRDWLADLFRAVPQGVGEAKG